MTLQFIRKLKREKAPPITTIAKQEELKKYIFIIDEINRGEISKIFGELFFAVDPGYRGKAGEISTQYANLHYSKIKFNLCICLLSLSAI